MKNKLIELLNKRKEGITCGIPSYCCANKLTLEAVIRQAKRFDDVILIEGTSNQVNQFGGYTGMKPQDFADFVYAIADENDFPRDMLILGGDHLGPLTWTDEPESSAMEKAAELVRLFVLAGFTKIHLDTSMRLGDDSKTEALSVHTVARRGAYLYQVCEKAYAELKAKNPDAAHPVYIIGSEVPIPGGSQVTSGGCEVTHVEDLENTISAYREEFGKLGLDDAWNHIIAVVVQPGVEFGNEEIVHYDRRLSFELCETLKKYPNLVFEGHSTDYQTPWKLKEMVEDGIAILKVGPALTFAMREGLFALSHIEELLVPEEKRANFPQVLENAMMSDQSKWKKHYSGNDDELYLQRKFSYSDRCRYYFAEPEVEAAMYKLFDNLDAVKIPMGLLHQYMPMQYIKVRDGGLPLKAKLLAEDNVVTLVDDYNFAAKYNYVIANAIVK